MNSEIWAQIVEGIAAVCLVGGGLMSLAAGVGLLRFPDLHSRMHAATKPQVLGLLLFVIAAIVSWGKWEWVPIALLVWGLQILTAPVSAHVVGRAGYRLRHMRRDLLVRDELQQAVETISRNESVRAEVSDQHDD
jgi:multicomponent Na+:H+ antiporter subunit G